MASWNDLAIAIGVTAIAGTVVLLVVLALWPRRWATIDADTPETPETPIRITFAHGPTWQIHSLLDHRPVVIDTFTFRCRDDDQPGPWHHELMDGAIRLLPGQIARIPAPNDGELWDAATGWAVVDEGGGRRGSDYVHVTRAHP